MAEVNAIIERLRALLPDVEAARAFARTLEPPVDPVVADYLWTHIGFWGDPTWVDRVTKRPGMYIGGSDELGLRHTVYQVLDAPCALARLGDVDQITVELRGDMAFSIAVDSTSLARYQLVPGDGAGLASLFGEFGLKGCSPLLVREAWGLAPSCALSRHCRVRLWDEATALEQTFVAGLPSRPTQLPSEQLPTSLLPAPPGLEIDYDLDPRFFDPDVAFDLHAFVERLDSWAALTQTPFLLLDRRVGYARRFAHPRGLMDWLESLQAPSPSLGEAVQAELEEGDLRVRLAVRWLAGSEVEVHSFVNDVPTSGGTHRDGLVQGVSALRRAATRRRRRAGDPDHRHAGYMAAVAVDLPSPRFRNPVREVLANPEVVHAVRRATLELGASPMVALRSEEEPHVP